MKKKLVTTEGVNLPYKTPQEVLLEKKPKAYTTNDIKDPGPTPLRKIGELKLFDPIINKKSNHQMAKFGMTTGDLPSDLSELKSRLCLPCDERSSARMDRKREKKKAQVIQEFDSIVPWMDPDGNFQELDPAIYKGLAMEEKRAYNLAKAREAKKKKKDK